MTANGETTSTIRVAPLALYEGDRLNRLLGRIGLGPRRPKHLLWRSVLLLSVTWLPMALLATWEGLYRGLANNFFADFAAYAQFFIGLPLFVIAEAVVIRATGEAGIEFATAGVLRHPAKLLQLDELHRDVSRLKNAAWIDVACVLMAFNLSGWIVGAELLRHGPLENWHTAWRDSSTRALTVTGWWAFGVAIPLLNYWWLRHVARIFIWTHYLYRVSRLRLDLLATHPDRTGGIGFISDVQGHFAWVIFAYGLTNVAAPVGYELAVLGVDLWIPPVWGPLLGFIIGAPLLFTLPLFLFTRRLAITKMLARRRYRRLLTGQTRRMESKVMPLQAQRRVTPEVADFGVVTQLSQLFERIEAMRVVPFDFRSLLQLLTSSLGSVVTVLPLLHVEGSIGRILEALVKILERLPFAH